jgi:translation initiation factor 2 subunit 2
MTYEELLDKAYEKVEVNLESEVERFEIPKVKGHHLGSKTVVSNFLVIASHIRRDPVHLMKFLSRELASQGEIQNDRLLLSRKLSSKEINGKIERYVNSFVLCAKCKKPDTELVEEGGKNFLRCLACGERVEVHKV